MSLHNSCTAIDINNQTRQIIALTVYQTVDIVILAVCQAKRTAQFICNSKPFVPKSMVNRFFLERKYTDGNTAHLNMAYGNPFPVTCTFKFVPALSGVTVGFAIIICALVASLLGAAFFPMKDDESNDDAQGETCT